MASRVCDLVNGVTHLVSQKASHQQFVWFLSLWESAWNRVPAASKRVIEKYWREGLAPESCRRKPNVKERYDPHVCLYKETQYDENAAPGITLEGHAISFPMQFMESLRRDHAVVAIAHELAHVSFYAEAEPNH